MGLGSFFKKAVGTVTGVGLLNKVGGGGLNPTSALLSGIPFLGEGFAAQQAQNHESNEALRQMGFQEYMFDRKNKHDKMMSDTAHQREMADLKAAGLNPLLSANTGASTPVSASASGASGKGHAGSGAGSSANMLKSLVNLEHEKAESDIQRTRAETKVARITENVQRQQEQVLKNSAKSIKEDIERKKSDNVGAKVKSDFDKKYGTLLLELDSVLNLFQKGASSSKDIRGVLKKDKPHPPKQPYKRNSRRGYRKYLD